jgi:hypothetical protein
MAVPKGTTTREHNPGCVCRQGHCLPHRVVYGRRTGKECAGHLPLRFLTDVLNAADHFQIKRLLLAHWRFTLFANVEFDAP